MTETHVIVNTGFYGLTLENAVAQSETPDYVSQIAEQYKKANEYYRVIETNNGVDKAYFVIVYYKRPETEKEITGSIIIDMTSQKLLDKNELSQSDFENILKYTSLVFYHDIEQHDALTKGQYFYDLSIEAREEAEIIQFNIGKGSVLTVINLLELPVEVLTNPILKLLAGACSIKSGFEGTAQILSIQEHMINMEMDYIEMGNLYEELGYYWFRIAENKYEYADNLIPRSSSPDQRALDAYIDALENVKFIASQDISVAVYCIERPWYVHPLEEIERLNQVISKYVDMKSTLEGQSVNILSNYNTLKPDFPSCIDHNIKELISSVAVTKIKGCPFYSCICYVAYIWAT